MVMSEGCPLGTQGSSSRLGLSWARILTQKPNQSTIYTTVWFLFVHPCFVRVSDAGGLEAQVSDVSETWLARLLSCLVYYCYFFIELS